MKTCSHPDFLVTVTTGSGIDGARLTVSRRSNTIGHWPACEHNGRLFPSSDDAWAFALDYGYIQRYFSRSSVVSQSFAKLAFHVQAARFDALYRLWKHGGKSDIGLGKRLSRMAKAVSIFHRATKAFNS